MIVKPRTQILFEGIVYRAGEECPMPDPKKESKKIKPEELKDGLSRANS